jgi:hypothetical protein
VRPVVGDVFRAPDQFGPELKAEILEVREEGCTYRISFVTRTGEELERECSSVEQSDGTIDPFFEAKIWEKQP